MAQAGWLMVRRKPISVKRILLLFTNGQMIMIVTPVIPISITYARMIRILFVDVAIIKEKLKECKNMIEGGSDRVN